MSLEIDLNQLKHFNIAPHSIVDKDHRSVTQSLAISPGVTTWLYRRSDPGTVCCRHLNFDRFHRTCLQDVGIVVRLLQTQHHTSWLWAVTHAALFATQLGNVSEMLVRCRSQVLTTAAVVTAAAATPHPDTNCARQIAG